MACPIAGQLDGAALLGVAVAFHVVLGCENVAVVAHAGFNETVQSEAAQAHAQRVVIRAGARFYGDAALHLLRRAPLPPPLRLRRGYRQSPGQQHQGEAACNCFPHGPPDVTPHRSAITCWTTAVNAQPYAYSLTYPVSDACCSGGHSPLRAPRETLASTERLSVPRPQFCRILGAHTSCRRIEQRCTTNELAFQTRAGRIPGTPERQRCPSAGAKPPRAGVLLRAQPRNARLRVTQRGTIAPRPGNPEHSRGMARIDTVRTDAAPVRVMNDTGSPAGEPLGTPAGPPSAPPRFGCISRRAERRRAHCRPDGFRHRNRARPPADAGGDRARPPGRGRRPWRPLLALPAQPRRAAPPGGDRRASRPVAEAARLHRAGDRQSGRARARRRPRLLGLERSRKSGRPLPACWGAETDVGNPLRRAAQLRHRVRHPAPPRLAGLPQAIRPGRRCSAAR